MNSITFTIDRAEVEKVVGEKLSPGITDKVLSMVENDIVLWNDIERSIINAVGSLKQT